LQCVSDVFGYDVGPQLPNGEVGVDFEALVKSALVLRVIQFGMFSFSNLGASSALPTLVVLLVVFRQEAEFSDSVRGVAREAKISNRTCGCRRECIEHAFESG
jgi:hypothetical protein